MGGFALFEDGVHVRTLEISDLERLESEGKIDWPNITVEEINDKSKGDYFSKGVVILQTCWFIAQCIARGAKRMALTELEIVTLAFSSLTMIIYFLWWNKPLDVGVPTPVYLKEGFSVQDAFEDWETKASVHPEAPGCIIIEIGEVGDPEQVELPNEVKAQDRPLQQADHFTSIEKGPTSSPPDVAEECTPSAAVTLTEVKNFERLHGSITPQEESSTKHASAEAGVDIQPNVDENTWLRSSLDEINLIHLPCETPRNYIGPAGGLQNGTSNCPRSDDMVPQVNEGSESSSFIDKFFEILAYFIVIPGFIIAYLFKLIFWILRPILKLLYFLCIYSFIRLFRAIQDTYACVSLSKDTPRRVATFYSPVIEEDGWIYVVVVAVATLFGGIHCIAWSFYFPTDIERLLWKITSILITGAPIALIFSAIFIAKEGSVSWYGQMISYSIGFLDLALIIAYVGSRFCLLALPLLALRALPPEAFVDIDWGAFIPHIHI